MKISKDDFFSIGNQLHIPPAQLNSFWTILEKNDETAESSPFARYLYYFGALVVIATMTWFMDFSWKQFGPGGVFIVSSLYALFLAIAGAKSWDKPGLRIPAGLLLTIAVFIVPLAIYALETYLDVWPKEYPGGYQGFFNWIKSSWVFMDLGAIVAGLIAMRYFPFPFLTVPIYLFSWYLVMDALPLFFGEVSLNLQSWVSLVFGLVLIAFGLSMDAKAKKDYGFWSYLCGAIAFWAALNMLMWDKGELILFLYFVINIFMMCFSVLVRRNIFMVLGAFGVFLYFGHLAYDLFKDTFWFPLVLSFIGLAIIYLGVLYQKNSIRIERAILNLMPTSLKGLISHRKDIK